MNLVERHQITKRSKFYKECLDLTTKSALLYNASLYAIRQHFFNHNEYLSYEELSKKFISENNPDFRALPAKVSQQTMRMVNNNFKSFFALLKSNKVANKNIRIPGYIKEDSNKSKRYVVQYTKQAISLKYFKNGIITLSGTNIKIKANKSPIQSARIIPKKNHFVIEIIYIATVKQNPNLINTAAIDLGINNLATLVIPGISNPIIYNGKPLKSINQFYNKEVATIKDHKLQSKKLQRLSYKRNNKVKDYLHKISREIVNYLVSKNVSHVIIGHNKGWKQSINIGKVNNQKFVNIPHSTFIQMLTYKGSLEGIVVKTAEESYTSKCSAIDLEPVKKHQDYLGKRIKRGLFKSHNGKLVNADVNAAYNIYRKHVVGNINLDPIEVCSTPAVYTVKI